MSSAQELEFKIREVVNRDPRYSAEAYRFTLEAFNYAQTRLAERGHQGHLDGRQLLIGIRDYARSLFGFLARTVFAEWGVWKTADFGEIVFNLVEIGHLSKQETDSKDDFVDVFDFEEAFERKMV